MSNLPLEHGISISIAIIAYNFSLFLLKNVHQCSILNIGFFVQNCKHQVCKKNTLKTFILCQLIFYSFMFCFFVLNLRLYLITFILEEMICWGILSGLTILVPELCKDNLFVALSCALTLSAQVKEFKIRSFSIEKNKILTLKSWIHNF